MSPCFPSILLERNVCMFWLGSAVDGGWFPSHLADGLPRASFSASVTITVTCTLRGQCSRLRHAKPRRKGRFLASLNFARLRLVMVTNVDRGATPSKKPSRMERVLRAAIWIMGISTVVPFLAVLFPGSQQHEPRPLGVTHFRQAADFYTVVQFPKSKTRFHASNNENVTWAVYFYKPYCGACKRIRPVVEALGSTVNHTNALRFAALDCTKCVHFPSIESIVCFTAIISTCQHTSLSRNCFNSRTAVKHSDYVGTSSVGSLSKVGISSRRDLLGTLLR